MFLFSKHELNRIEKELKTVKEDLTKNKEELTTAKADLAKLKQVTFSLFLVVRLLKCLVFFWPIDWYKYMIA